MNKPILRVMLLLVVVGGCSNKQIYTAIQQNRQQECRKLPRVQYEACMREFDQSYEDYARDREDALSDKP